MEAGETNYKKFDTYTRKDFGPEGQMALDV